MSPRTETDRLVDNDGEHPPLNLNGGGPVGNNYGSNPSSIPSPSSNPPPAKLCSKLKAPRPIPQVSSRDDQSRTTHHTYSESFFGDALNFREGTIPQSILVAFVVGIVCGVGAYGYYEFMEYGLEFFWHTIPNHFVVGKWPEWAYPFWIPIIGIPMALAVALTVMYVGEPGDMAYAVKCVHSDGYVELSHVIPMVLASQFSIIGGSSVGPEAPLVAICAALGGFVSIHIFKQTNRNVIRKHTLMGMSGALSAFFGCPLGGSLFALEINSRFGVEYFEHVVESIFCGEVCLVVFRWMAGMKMGAIWEMDVELGDAEPGWVILGALFGLLGAGIAAIFAWFHWNVVELFYRFGLLEKKNAIKRILWGSTIVLAIGACIPHTMFWGETEFQQITTAAPTSELDHVFPASSLIGFEATTSFNCFLVGIFKLITISLSIASGYRGGFIFPLFAVGGAFGKSLMFIFPSLNSPIACLCLAGAINTAITRTCLATTLLLVYLAKEQTAISAILAANLVSLFATSYMPFIQSQIARSDLDDSLYFSRKDHLGEEWKMNRHHGHNDSTHNDESNVTDPVMKV